MRPSRTQETGLLLPTGRQGYWPDRTAQVAFSQMKPPICFAGQHKQRVLVASPVWLLCFPSAGRCWTPLKGQSSPPRSVGTTLRETSKQQWHPQHGYMDTHTHTHTPQTHSTLMFFQHSKRHFMLVQKPDKTSKLLQNFLSKAFRLKASRCGANIQMPHSSAATTS